MITLDHTIVPVADRFRGAGLLGELIGVEPDQPAGPFIPLRINAGLTFDFDDRFGARTGHYAFRVDEAVFDHALHVAIERDLEWGSAPRVADRHVDTAGGGRRVYIRDPDGIAYEFFTKG